MVIFYWEWGPIMDPVRPYYYNIWVRVDVPLCDAKIKSISS